MPREFSPEFEALLANPLVESFSILDLHLSGGTIKRYARRAFTDEGGNTYEARLDSVGELRQSLSIAADRVNVKCMNNDGAIGTIVASDLRYFANAVAYYNRYYLAAGSDQTFKKILFRGKVVSVKATRRLVSFDIMDSLVVAGPIIAARTLASNCSFRYRDPNTCGSTDTRDKCNKSLLSNAGCSGDSTSGQTNRFGGWFFPYGVVVTPPAGGSGPGSGTGSPTGGGGGTYGPGEGGGGDLPSVRLPCFTEGTLITLGNGRKVPIKDIKVGDTVRTFYYDEENQKECVTARRVVKTFVHEVPGFYRFRFSGKKRAIEVTGEHPLYKGKGAFYLADYVRHNEALQFANRKGKFKVRHVTSREWVEADTTVYNFHVEGTETYFAEDLAVHNRKRDPYEQTFL